ncbi:MAG: RnfABCDGE type electron transport complex subunit B [Kiritimatiellaeota bacterium]|nr:RnfABCDGE type electron transport complex subunit B [Kiritimatiellota bacterium]
MWWWPIAVLVIMGVGFGLVIGAAVKFFGVETDPRIEQVEELLPGANCGACGLAGCAEFAKALVAGETAVENCPSSPSEAAARIAALLGVEVGERDPKVAVAFCGGDSSIAKWAAEYNGVNDCRSAALVAGGAAKGCLFGCLGLGSCARVCPFGAIEITDKGLAVVHPELCTGCGKCIRTCPRNLIRLVPKSAPLHVLCSSPEKGAAKTKVCKASCIGCRKCVKSAGEGQMVMDGFLARVNYDDPPGSELAEVCPTGCLRPSLSIEAAAQTDAAETQETANA